MDRNEKRILIAKRIAKELHDGDVVNLGIGLPTMVANYVPDDVNITLQSENGFVGLGPAPEEDNEDPNITNAGGQPVTINSGGAFFDSVTSFGIIRGGHIDMTVLGALQVDQKGNLANWMIPGKLVPGMGGAMDLTVGAKKVVVATQHVTKKGGSKIFKECSLPLTAKEQVDLIVTDMAVMEVTSEGLVLKEIGPETTVEKIKEVTDADLIVADDVKQMDVKL